LPHPTSKDKQDELQRLIDERVTDANLIVKFRRFVGWFAEYPEPRHPGDSGMFLGRNVTEAKRSIRQLWQLW